MRKLWTVAEMTLREMLRRRAVLALLLALPLGFYLIRRGDHTGQSIRSLFLGLAWAVSTAALFSSTASRAIEPRLRLSGYRSHHLYLGRMAALLVLGLAIALPLLGLVALDPGHTPVRLAAVALAMLFCVTVATPFGLLVAALLPRELEGTLLLLVIVGLQMTIDPASAGARLTPFWSSREIGTYAIDFTDAGYLTRGLLHGAAFTATLAVLVAALSTIRLRTRGHLRFPARP
jgi:hypothetical protein